MKQIDVKSFFLFSGRKRLRSGNIGEEFRAFIEITNMFCILKEDK